MYMFPEPPPIDYYITDVSRSYLTDGVFHYGKPAVTHKYVAKQLRPIKRTLSDPVAPVQEIDSSTLDQWLEKEREGYVDHCGQDEGKIYETLQMMPRWEHDHRTSQRSLFSIFPRSPQYELWYIRERRAKDFEKHEVATVECTKTKLPEDKSVEETCGFLVPPFWWKGRSERSRSLPVGNINDYTFESLKEFDRRDTKISEKLQMDHPRKYIPGVIHRMKNPEDTGMTDVLEEADAFRVVLKDDQILEKVASPVDKCSCSPPLSRSVGRESKRHQDVRGADKTQLDNDRRWQPLYEKIGFSGTDLERQEELRKLTKPFSHDLHTWYTRNKPTKLMSPVKYPGKRPILEKRFSHL